MKRRIKEKYGTSILIALLVLMTLVPFFYGSGATEQAIELDSEAETVELTYDLDDDVNRLTYSLNGFNAVPMEIDGEEYFHLSIPGESNSMVKGEPELPNVARSMIIPDDARMDIRVVDAEYVEYGSVSIAPSRGSLSRTEHPDLSAVPYEFGDVYELDGWYPREITNLRDPYILRDFRGQVVELYPFQYHPTRNKLRIYTEVEVEVFSVGRGGENVLNRRRPLDTVSRDFARIYERRFINYQETLNSLMYDPVEEDGNMLVISYDDFSGAMDDFVDWKNTRGLPTELVELSEIGSTANDISNYIEDYYHSEGLTYVLLVGDNDRVPSPIVNVGGVDPGNKLSDPSYSFIDGDDYYPDLFVGRFSASNIAHVETQVERSIEYEQNPDPDGVWRQRAMGLACDEGPGYQGMMDYEFMDYLRDRLLGYEYNHVDRFYDSGYGELPGSPNSGHVSSGIEEGRHLINYVGHGMTTFISTSGFDTGDMAALTNDKLPFFITVACLTGNHGASTNPCFAEQWTRVTHNGAPTGGIAAFSSSKSQAWAEPMAAQDEMMHLYTESYADNIKTTTGGIAFNGCMFMNDEYGTSGYYETITWTMFGDPSAVITGEEFDMGDPPEVSVTGPTGGETFNAGTQETITWSTTPGDNPVDHINLEYSVDAGSNWQTIDTNLANTGSYTWTVPNEHSSDCLVRVEAVDTAGRSGDGESAGTFTIVGTPPAPPENLAVEHTGTGVVDLFYDDVEGGDLGYTTGTSESEASEWGIRSHGATIGSNSWDFGDGQYHKVNDYGYLSWLISPEIEIPESASDVELSFDHWRSFGYVTTYLDGGNFKLSTDGVNGNFDLITPNEGYDGEINPNFDNPLGGQQGWGGTVGWETVTFDLSAYAGETIHLRWDAGIEAYDEDIEDGWRVDNIRVTGEVVGIGDEHNLLTWDASPDDPDEVSAYNVYRSEDAAGTYDHIGSVSADGSAFYEYIDVNKGADDGIQWWYMVRAIGTNGLEEQNENAVPEPDDLTTTEVPLTSGGAADGWNFVSFNVVPQSTSLVDILEDPEHGISGQYDSVMYYDSSADRWYSYVPDRPDHFNDVDSWDHTMGLWIQANEDVTLTVEGTTPQETTIMLQPGWNMVGLPSETTGNHGLPAEVTSVGYFDASSEYNIVYTDSVSNFQFSPGEAYWVYNNAGEVVPWTIEF